MFLWRNITLCKAKHVQLNDTCPTVIPRNCACVKQVLIGWKLIFGYKVQQQLIHRTVAYMWTLPDLQGGSLKWALNFLLKHTAFSQNLEISLIWIKNFPIYSIHFLSPSLKWKENLPDALLKLITCMQWNHFRPIRIQDTGCLLALTTKILRLASSCSWADRF